MRPVAEGWGCWKAAGAFRVGTRCTAAKPSSTGKGVRLVSALLVLSKSPPISCWCLLWAEVSQSPEGEGDPVTTDAGQLLRTEHSGEERMDSEREGNIQHITICVSLFCF